ncbi:MULTISPECIES: YcaO-like family protein [Agrobacterium]|uniref:YcaO-like family protein n=1 Tax=Agrobacterium TaxID=357 RepID=UPI003B9EBA5B
MSDLLDFCEVLVNNRCGIINTLTSEPVPQDIDNLFIFRAEVARPLNYDLSGPVEGYSDQVVVSGVGTNSDSALRSVLGEGIERYSLMTYRHDLAKSATIEDLTAPALHPSDLIGYTPSQYQIPNFPYSPFDPQSKIHWALGHELSSGTNVYLPASLIWMGIPLLKKDLKFSQSVSSGAAAGASYEQAALGALLELIERDALICRWLIKAAPSKVTDTLVLDQSTSRLVSQLQQRGAQIDFYDLAVEAFSPVICTRLQWKDKFPGFVLGTSSSVSRPKAAAKALQEALHVYNNARLTREDENGTERIHEYNDIQTFSDHGHYYRKFADLTATNFFEEDGTCVPTEDLSGSSFSMALETLVQRVSDTGKKVIIIDITPPEIAALGFTVVRCLIPGLQPITAGAGIECHDTRRLREVSSKLRVPMSKSLNTRPHPLS